MSYTDAFGVELPEAVPAVDPAGQRWRRNGSLEPHQGYVMCARGGDYRMLPRGLDPTLPAPGTVVTYGDTDDALADVPLVNVPIDPSGAPTDLTAPVLQPVEPAESAADDEAELQVAVKGKRVHPLILAGVACVVVALWTRRR